MDDVPLLDFVEWEEKRDRNENDNSLLSTSNIDLTWLTIRFLPYLENNTSLAELNCKGLNSFFKSGTPVSRSYKAWATESSISSGEPTLAILLVADICHKGQQPIRREMRQGQVRWTDGWIDEKISTVAMVNFLSSWGVALHQSNWSVCESGVRATRMRAWPWRGVTCNSLSVKWTTDQEHDRLLESLLCTLVCSRWHQDQGLLH